MRFTNFTPSNLNTVYNAYKSNDYLEYFRGFSDFLNKEQLASELVVRGSLTAVEDDTGIFLGHVTALIIRKPKIAEIGIMILKEHQNKGTALQAMKQLCDFLFKDGIRRVVGTVSADDLRINDLLKKGGFTYDGKLIKSCYYNSHYVNEHRYSLSKEKYNKIYKGKE